MHLSCPAQVTFIAEEIGQLPQGIHLASLVARGFPNRQSFLVTLLCLRQITRLLPDDAGVEHCLGNFSGIAGVGPKAARLFPCRQGLFFFSKTEMRSSLREPSIGLHKS